VDIEVEITRKDFVNFNRYWYFKKKLKSRVWLILVFAFGLPLILNSNTDFNLAGYLGTVIVSGVLFGSIFLGLMWFILGFTGNTPDKGGSILGAKKFSITENALIEDSDSNRNEQRWKSIKSIEENGSAIFIFIDNIAAYIIPKRGFKDEVEQQAFVDLMELNIKRASN
jgi:hypothetical protein